LGASHLGQHFDDREIGGQAQAGGGPGTGKLDDTGPLKAVAMTWRIAEQFLEKPLVGGKTIEEVFSALVRIAASTDFTVTGVT
jgi:hypothetical protein